MLSGAVSPDSHLRIFDLTTDWVRLSFALLKVRASRSLCGKCGECLATSVLRNCKYATMRIGANSDRPSIMQLWTSRCERMIEG